MVAVAQPNIASMDGSVAQFSLAEITRILCVRGKQRLTNNEVGQYE